MIAYWLLLGCTVASNVLANVAFKLTMRSIEGPLGTGMVAAALTKGWFWAGTVACATLLGSYLLALRQLGLSASYAVVTSSALVGISVTSHFVFGERLTSGKMLGIALVIAGLFLIVRDELARLAS